MSSYEDLPEEWTVTAIDEILADLGNGKKLHQGWSPQCEKGPCSSDVDWGVLKTTAIQAGQFEPQHHKRLPDHLEPKHAIEVRPGDMVITCAGPRIRCGIACLVRATRPRLLLSGKMYRFRFPPQIDPRYMEAYLQSEDARLAIDAMKTGGNESGLNLTHDRFRRLSVPIAPTVEQIRIADKLEELFSDLDAGVAELRAAQKKLAQYRQSLLKAAVEGALTAEWRDNQRKARTERGEITETGAQLLERILAERRSRWEEKQLAKFNEQGKAPPKDWLNKYPEPLAPETIDRPQLPKGWVWASIDQLMERIVDGTHHTPKYVTKGVPFISVKDIRDRKIHFDDCRYVEVETHQELIQRCQPEIGDLLVTKSGTIGRTAIVATSERFSLFVSVALLKAASTLVQMQWVECAFSAWLQSINIANEIKGTAVKNLHLEDFRSLCIPIPPAAEQEAIMDAFSVAWEDGERLLESTEIALKKSTAQRKNILKAAFSGKLVPQDSNDVPASVLLERIRAERAAYESNGKRHARKPALVAKQQEPAQNTVRLEENELTQ